MKKLSPIERIATALESIDLSLQVVISKQALWSAMDENEKLDKEISMRDLSHPVLPEVKDTIAITERPDLKTSEILDLMKSKFPVWSWYDNDKLNNDFPAPKEATTRLFLNQQEPDKETLGLSVRQCEEKGFKDMISLRERLLLELAYFDATGKHMDVDGITFCGGSRNSDGGVPSVYFYTNSKVDVNWYFLDSSNSKCGIRRAVTL